ncbi:MAG: hypothetical protein PWQ14_966 [Rikenellaceae bacterium]|nr:hypothetical protein [Rikenellaceae bacterium]
MKKNLKTHLRDVLIYLTSGSILLSSCESPYVESFTSENFAKDENTGKELIPINIYLNKKDQSLIKFIQQFAHDVLTNPRLSVEFKENPKKVLANYNLEGLNIDTKSPEIQIILTLGDKEIQETLLKGDFTKYIKLLKEKELLQSDKVKALDKIFQTKGDITIENEEQLIPLLAICFVVALIYVAVATVEVQVPAVSTAVLCTTPVVAVATAIVERAIAVVQVTCSINTKKLPLTM